jgi:hypothetical protein
MRVLVHYFLFEGIAFGEIGLRVLSRWRLHISYKV